MTLAQALLQQLGGNPLVVMTAETARTVAGVDSRFFIIQRDGSIRNINATGQGIRWCFNQRLSALVHAKRKGAMVYDKKLGAFIVE